ncbi:hypothetical protein RND71_036783 [Anisodus tanguticus]|uniref:Uncharacterized protein n=1 Tax=Anisodus tanguticus TaxID=243964 RepID=A0AAE1V062_9SOLA|nr:hypothetical protein RND71_036783 [Anisodus tanguticus]
MARAINALAIFGPLQLCTNETYSLCLTIFGKGAHFSRANFSLNNDIGVCFGSIYTTKKLPIEGQNRRNIGLPFRSRRFFQTDAIRQLKPTESPFFDPGLTTRGFAQLHFQPEGCEFESPREQRELLRGAEKKQFFKIYKTNTIITIIHELHYVESKSDHDTHGPLPLYWKLVTDLNIVDGYFLNILFTWIPWQSTCVTS